MLIGGWRALAQRDAKLLLAHGTTSQLGLLVVLFGAGYEKATLAGAAVLLAHGAFKAALFMVVGIVDHKAGTRDITRLSGMYRPLRTTFLVAARLGGLDGRPAADARLRRQGGGVRGVRRRAAAAVAAGHPHAARRGLGADVRLQRPFPLGRVRRQEAGRARARGGRHEGEAPGLAVRRAGRPCWRWRRWPSASCPAR
jgi:hypothetical protein